EPNPLALVRRERIRRAARRVPGRDSEWELARGHSVRWRAGDDRLFEDAGIGADSPPVRHGTTMRVVQLGPYPPPHGGVQTNLVAIRQFLEQRGIACEAINLTRFRRPDADGVHYPRNAAGLLKLLLEL